MGTNHREQCLTCRRGVEQARYSLTRGTRELPVYISRGHMQLRLHVVLTRSKSGAFAVFMASAFKGVTGAHEISPTISDNLLIFDSD